MSAYANVHIALEQMRVRALSKARGSPLPPGEDADPKLCEAPRVLILGPENAGKTTVAKILTNYAVRGGQLWTPLLANVDPSEVSSPLCYSEEISHSDGQLLLNPPSGSLGHSWSSICNTCFGRRTNLFSS